MIITPHLPAHPLSLQPYPVLNPPEKQLYKWVAEHNIKIEKIKNWKILNLLWAIIPVMDR